MNFRAYDILTQLIPGLFLIIFLGFFSDFEIRWQKLETGAFAVLTIICFIIGYLINAIGHFLETLLVNKKINSAVKAKIHKGIAHNLLSIFGRFTKLSHIDHQLNESKHEYFTQDYDNISDERYPKLDWLNQEKKFARSVITMTLMLLILVPWIGLNRLADGGWFYIYLVLLLLLIAGVYRYIVGSIDYASWVIKYSAQKDSKTTKE